jgi:BirA family biotin operon repressor/biotin-[acetyl-CoA-carboxylase] ligase
MPGLLAESTLLPPLLSRALSLSKERIGAFGEQVHYFTKLESTNDVALQMAHAGAEHGTTVIAETQIAGRGRESKSWFSPPGVGLYVSVVFKGFEFRDTTLNFGDRVVEFTPGLTLMAGVALTEAIQLVSGLPVELKWPNDVVIQGSSVNSSRKNCRQKLAGILTEASTGAGDLNYAVVGFGLNVHVTKFPEELAALAGSIEAELGRSVNSIELLVEVLASLSSWYTRFKNDGLTSILDRWRELSPLAKGVVVRWQDSAGFREGVTAGIDDDGALLIRIGHETERFISGELVWS